MLTTRCSEFLEMLPLCLGSLQNPDQGNDNTRAQMSFSARIAKDDFIATRQHLPKAWAMHGLAIVGYGFSWMEGRLCFW